MHFSCFSVAFGSPPRMVDDSVLKYAFFILMLVKPGDLSRKELTNSENFPGKAQKRDLYMDENYISLQTD